MDHAVDAFLQFDERAVAGEVANLALDRGCRSVNFFSISSHGLVSSWRRPREIFCSSLLMPSTTASISWPTLRTSDGRDALGPGKFGDVDEAFDALFEFDERAVGNEVGDLAFDLRCRPGNAPRSGPTDSSASA